MSNRQAWHHCLYRGKHFIDQWLMRLYTITKKTPKNTIFINITKLKTGSETSPPGRFLWTSHAMLRIASNISEGHMRDIAVKGEEDY